MEWLLCLVAAAAVTYLLTPLARELAKKWKVMAPVRDRDVHDTPTPLLGGLAMVGGLLAGGILASKLPMMSAVFDSGRTPLALLSGVAIIVALGVVDDKWGLDAPTKLAGQVLAAPPACESLAVFQCSKAAPAAARKFPLRQPRGDQTRLE